MDTSPDYDAYDATMAAMAKLEAEILPLNKAALFAALAAAGIVKVMIHFSGCGDSGQLDSLLASDAEDTEVPVPTTEIEFKTVSFEGPTVVGGQMRLEDALEKLTYKLLEDTHGGWEDGQGSDADFTFDVPAAKITLSYDEHYVESTNYIDTFWERVMAHSYFHALSSARRWGGKPEDYIEIHNWIDGSKVIIADFRHRALRHHAEGCWAAEAIFGVTIVNSQHRAVPVRAIAEQHILEDLGRVSGFADWVRCIRPEPWMGRPGEVPDNASPPGPGGLIKEDSSCAT